MTEYFDKEMAKLEKQQKSLREQQEKGQWDRYNTIDQQVDQNDYNHLLNSDLEYAPKRGQSWKEYAVIAQLYARQNAKISIKTHVECKRQWYTHRSPLGCFMCSDINLISVLQRTIALMAEQYPSQQF